MVWEERLFMRNFAGQHVLGVGMVTDGRGRVREEDKIKGENRKA